MMPSHAHRRPHWLIILIVSLALFQLGAAIRTLQVPDALAAQITLPLPLEFIVGILWALVFAWLTPNLIRLKSNARRHTVWAVIGFAVYSVARLLLFTQADYDRQRLPFLLIATVLILAIPVTYLLRQSTNGETRHEREP
jgi:hypothetical protein